MPNDRLEQQIRFIVEIDKLKHVLRQTLLMDSSRQENDAEHSWHLAVMAILLAEYAPEPRPDILRVIKMLLIHDIVEIDAGDSFLYDTARLVDKQEREERAAERLFNILPTDLAGDMRVLWDDFEAQQTPEARFAAALDRLQPMLHNYHTQGAAWRKHGITSDRVIERNRHMAAGAPALWEYARSLVDEAVKQGFLEK